ncbi:hypothetical protein [Microvirga tunisiensis]|uniref:Uncharacterized protein n=1 Tax=Microvirga tunisiensis TaxID=2108360 RepID=A0A5N7MVG1_9HYPH|nr:hypothetical protein [Microvirga tunisiensis]MPR28056.1 hypothetical protein [Microvirga tunisiensis]
MNLPLKIFPLLLGTGVIAACLYRNRIKELRRPQTIAEMLDRLPLRGDFALIAIIKGHPEYRAAFDLSSKAYEGPSVRIDVYFTDRGTGEVVAVASQQVIEPSGKCGISAALPTGVANFSVDLREGVNLFRLGEPGVSTLPGSPPPAGRSGRVADAILRGSELTSTTGLKAARRAVAKALHPDADPVEQKERTAALAWANAELDRIQLSLSGAK